MFDYVRDPNEIVRLSFARIHASVDCENVPENLREVLYRMVHACGVVDIAGDFAWRGDPVGAVQHALQEGRPIIGDCQMVLAGVAAVRLPADNQLVCTLNDNDVAAFARDRRITRSAVAVERWRPYLHNAIVMIGNAPTALFRLLELIQTEPLRPAAILACPVGFVGAAESKEALLQAAITTPCLTLRGRRGGSAITVAALNAILLSLS